MTRKVVSTAAAPAAIGPYSQAIISGSFVFTSGQLGIHPSTGELVSDDITEQVRQVIANLGSILQEAGTSFGNVVKTTVFLTNPDDFPIMNAEYAKHFSKTHPARSTVFVAQLPKNALVAIEAIAALDTV